MLNVQIQQTSQSYLHPVVHALKSLETGRLVVRLPNGQNFLCQGTKPGRQADINFHTDKALEYIATRGSIGLGESYMQGLWSASDLKSLMNLMADNCEILCNHIHGTPFFQKIYFLKHAIIRANTRQGSRKNIHAHYDLSNDFYKLWLDETMTYSGALFHGDASQTLQEAQRAKYGRILDRLSPITDDQNVLEIGCGWGGFMEEATKNGHNVTGITISKKQAEYAKTRLKQAGLDKLAQVKLQDYRDITTKYDYVVSIGMIEHVGEAFWPDYMAAIYKALKPGGKAMIQSIVIRDDLFESYKKSSDFIREHVLPGGMLPSLFRLKAEALGAGLEIKDVFHFGQDYAITLDKWLARFDENRAAIKSMGFDDVFIRKWRFYLASCSAMFSNKRTDLVQIELHKPK